ncbi:hypothetical protein CEXT_440371 [Caerostris extrusa]|uniref:Uncharacterized protein n=1 Tax=Caerostris extrusa TaxID=172846 RepID=A0AAV4V641_CAEEX|nr:hypothetical protein CEXT_440371 [Caerostris extrusa]
MWTLHGGWSLGFRRRLHRGPSSERPAPPNAGHLPQIRAVGQSGRAQLLQLPRVSHQAEGVHLRVGVPPQDQRAPGEVGDCRNSTPPASLDKVSSPSQRIE